MSLLTKEIAKEAIDLATPLILGLMDGDVTNRDDLHVVVAVNDDTPSPNEYELMAERSFGEPYRWDHNYADIARGKTMITARTGLTSRQVQLMQPELLVDGDVMFWGNTLLGNIIVSCSGVQPWFDEAISNTIAWLCRALIQERMEALKADAEGDTYDS